MVHGVGWGGGRGVELEFEGRKWRGSMKRRSGARGGGGQVEGRRASGDSPPWLDSHGKLSCAA